MRFLKWFAKAVFWSVVFGIFFELVRLMNKANAEYGGSHGFAVLIYLVGFTGIVVWIVVAYQNMSERKKLDRSSAPEGDRQVVKFLRWLGYALVLFIGVKMVYAVGAIGSLKPPPTELDLLVERLTIR